MSDLDPAERLAMEREADRQERERQYEEYLAREDRWHVEYLARAERNRDDYRREREHDEQVTERRHSEHMGRLDRIAAALEAIAAALTGQPAG